jgi:hypothetical protein
MLRLNKGESNKVNTQTPGRYSFLIKKTFDKIGHSCISPRLLLLLLLSSLGYPADHILQIKSASAIVNAASFRQLFQNPI